MTTREKKIQRKKQKSAEKRIKSINKKELNVQKVKKLKFNNKTYVELANFVNEKMTKLYPSEEYNNIIKSSPEVAAKIEDSFIKYEETIADMTIEDIKEDISDIVNYIVKNPDDLMNNLVLLSRTYVRILKELKDREDAI